MTAELLERTAAPSGARPAVSPKKKKRRRRRFSLNGLAIQLSAFALSFTLVALLVVSGSQAAFVEENESVTNYVPIGQAEPPADDDDIWTPRSPSSPASPATTEPTQPTEPAEEPEPEPDAVIEAVELTDSDAGTAMFADGAPLPPGVAEERCIEVTYAGDTDPRPVRLYAVATEGPLAPYLELTIDVGRADAGVFGSCSGFASDSTVFSGTLAGFVAAHSSYSTGAPTWDPASSGESRHFRFSVSVQDDPAAAGLSAVFGFSWETRDDA